MEPPTWLTISSLSPAPSELKLRLLALSPHHNHVVGIVSLAGPEAPGKQRSYYAEYSRGFEVIFQEPGKGQSFGMCGV